MKLKAINYEGDLYLERNALVLMLYRELYTLDDTVTAKQVVADIIYRMELAQKASS